MILRVRSIVEVLRRDHVEDRVLIVAHQIIVNCFRYLLECMDETKILGYRPRSRCTQLRYHGVRN